MERDQKISKYYIQLTTENEAEILDQAKTPPNRSVPRGSRKKSTLKLFGKFSDSFSEFFRNSFGKPSWKPQLPAGSWNPPF